MNYALFSIGARCGFAPRRPLLRLRRNADEALSDAGTMTRLRTRAASTLINVALLGAFSSGKSFLLSGLQGGLELVEVPTADGHTADKFVGLLPSSPVPTTACPASVVPVDGQSNFDASGTGFLRVRFTDSADDRWEEVGNSPAPSVVAAYAMQDADVTDRHRPHRGREVAELEILLASAKLPAKLYDLPGYGSPNPVHDMIVRTAMADADCFMYVSHASRTLSERDLDLIRFLYDHYLLSGKRVVWVVTAIDAAANLDLRNVPEWKATIARNNAYLRENFTLPSGQPDLGFIGEGFLPVSPALEARADRLGAQGAEAAAQRQRAESRMETLRQAIEDLISTGTGARHIAAVATEARILVAPRHQALSVRLRDERLRSTSSRSCSRASGSDWNFSTPRCRACARTWSANFTIASRGPFAPSPGWPRVSTRSWTMPSGPRTSTSPPRRTRSRC